MCPKLKGSGRQFTAEDKESKCQVSSCPWSQTSGFHGELQRKETRQRIKEILSLEKKETNALEGTVSSIFLSKLVKAPGKICFNIKSDSMPKKFNYLLTMLNYRTWRIGLTFPGQKTKPRGGDNGKRENTSLDFYEIYNKNHCVL